MRTIEQYCVDPSDRVRHEYKTNKTDKKREEWFCKNFNRAEGCQLAAPHEAYVGRPPHRRMVKHICAQCWIKDQAVKLHSEVDANCPYRV